MAEWAYFQQDNNDGYGNRFALHREWHGRLSISVGRRYQRGYSLTSGPDRSVSFEVMVRIAMYAVKERNWVGTKPLLGSMPEAIFSELLQLYVEHLLLDEEEE